jgi:hypothetical protein
MAEREARRVVAEGKAILPWMAAGERGQESWSGRQVGTEMIPRHDLANDFGGDSVDGDGHMLRLLLKLD